MTFASCNKSSVLEEQLPIPVRAAAETTSGTAAVEVENGMLKFADEAAIEQTLSMLLKMDEATLSAWYDSIGSDRQCAAFYSGTSCNHFVICILLYTDWRGDPGF